VSVRLLHLSVPGQLTSAPSLKSYDTTGWKLRRCYGHQGNQVRVRILATWRQLQIGGADICVLISRSGFPEDRDAFRLKNKGKTILCFRCKGSAAPIGNKVQYGLAPGRKMLSCDYCNLNWHADCLEPPLMVMPNPQKKWQCPNHASHVAVSVGAIRFRSGY
jgi:hypothetical protein